MEGVRITYRGPSEEEDAEFNQKIYRAGQCAPPGRYRQLDGNREVILTDSDILPASLDGHVAWYVQITPYTALEQAAQHLHRQEDKAHTAK